ncbi:hypothetical protein U14_00442 [Candidatus Moduliflexus flocculans]|uniref:Lcl C-terminal domain-containing protein n=1 Tax=Candidatus Moduliflexus flocculans TaxID=1499966 RepID=A0A0S6VQD3_9BACT|nr:hypothetical protein U14_00442 [Candidatus Moduliflexus flocculans]
MTYQEAEAYIAQINADNFGDYNDWRLPTVEELLSLLEQKQETTVRFILSERDFERLKEGEHPMPDDVIAELKSLQDRQFSAETDFISAVQQQIGAEDAARYQERLVEQAKTEYALYINPMFDSAQTWVWSSDIYQIKGKRSTEAAWDVYFGFGFVDAVSFNFRHYVRVVRS